MIAAKQVKTAADLPWGTAARGLDGEGKVWAPAVIGRDG
jgi:hypothetical protein